MDDSIERSLRSEIAEQSKQIGELQNRIKRFNQLQTELISCAAAVSGYAKLIKLRSREMDLVKEISDLVENEASKMLTKLNSFHDDV